MYFSLECNQVLPHFFRNVVHSDVVLRVVIGSSAEEEVPLNRRNLFYLAHDTDCVEERVHQLVLFEQTSANVDVELVCQIINNDLNTSLLSL